MSIKRQFLNILVKTIHFPRGKLRPFTLTTHSSISTGYMVESHDGTHFKPEYQSTVVAVAIFMVWSSILFTHQLLPGKRCICWHTELKSRPGFLSVWLHYSNLQTPDSSAEPAKQDESIVGTQHGHLKEQPYRASARVCVFTCQGHSVEVQASPSKLLRALLDCLLSHWLILFNLPQGNGTDRGRHLWLLLFQKCILIFLSWYSLSKKWISGI